MNWIEYSQRIERRLRNRQRRELFVIALLSLTIVYLLILREGQARGAEGTIGPESGSLVPRSRYQGCADRLMVQAGRTGPNHVSLPALYRRFSVDRGEEFLIYMLAVIYVESRFDRDAISEQGARGLMQLTPPAVEEAVGNCRLAPVSDPQRLHVSSINITIGTCYLRQLLREMDGDWTRALIVYNGGYRQLIRYDRGEPIVAETANYVLQVRRAVGFCSL